MFRMKRTRWISLGLVLAVLLLPLPATAGSLWEASTEGWGGAWQDLVEWLGSVVETSCAMVDPFGCPASATPPSSSSTESCAAPDPFGGCHS